jgi:hypothetical protein
LYKKPRNLRGFFIGINTVILNWVFLRNRKWLILYNLTVSENN